MQITAPPSDLARIGDLPSGYRDRRTVAFAAVTTAFAVPLGIVLLASNREPASTVVGIAMIAMLVVMGAAGTRPAKASRRHVARGLGLVAFAALGAILAPAIAGWLAA